MDLNFYSDLTDGAGQHDDPQFLDPQSFNGFDSDNKVTLHEALIRHDPVTVQLFLSLHCGLDG